MSTPNVNVNTLNDARLLDRNQDLLARSLSRLSSGSRIVSPSDDPAGTSTAERLSAQNKRVEAASTNIQNALSYVQSGVGFLGGMSQIVSRMSELALFAKDGMKNAEDISLYQVEFTELQEQLRTTIGGSPAEIGGTVNINRPLGSFNGNVLFGPNPAGMTIATGQRAGESMTIPETNLRTGAMLALFQQDGSGNFTLKVTDPNARDKIIAGLDHLADSHATLAAIGGRLNFAGGRLVTEGENLTAAISRIQDVDVAAESTRLMKHQILSQTGSAMLSQAAQSPRSVLKLLQET
jgi:flagellin